MEAATRKTVRWAIDGARRCQLGAELDEDGRTDLQNRSHGHQALALVAFEAAKGDPLLAVTLAIDELARRASV